jgi:hypothetical protein
MLAAAGRIPRQRARDQQADRIGEGLRRRVLDRLVALDPVPEGLHEALARIVAELGEPSGPTRAVCAQILEELRAARANPTYCEWLLAEALSAESPDSSRRRRRGPDPTP